MTTVNMLEAKTHLSKLVEAVESGSEKEIVIARNGKPVARIVPLVEPKRRQLGLFAGQYPDLSLDHFDDDNEEIWREVMSGAVSDDEPAP